MTRAHPATPCHGSPTPSNDFNLASRWSVSVPDSASSLVGAVPTPLRYSVADWAAEIKQHVARGKAGNLTLGRLLYEAKSKLRYGQWTELWRSGQIPFSKRKGEHLVVIGENLGSLDANTSSHLPPAWRTLYLLAHLDRATLLRLIAEAVIHPKLTAREANELLPAHAPQCRKSANVPGLRRRLANLAKFARTTLPKWSPDDHAAALAALRDITNEIQHSSLRFITTPHPQIPALQMPYENS
jgi:hypothetical protein